MRKLRERALAVLGTSVLVACSSGKQTLGWETRSDRYLPWPGGAAYYAPWSHGPPSDPSFFPLLVWTQNPENAARFRDVGVNFFSGLWDGPTETQLSGLAAAGMPAVCSQSGVWQEHLNDSTIRGWLQPDQPDDAQQNADGSYSACIEPSAIADGYARMVKGDPTRPVFMNLGRGVVDGNWVGRGSCSGRNDMYPEYVRGADVLTLVTYPLNAGLPLETIATGVDNLRRFVHDQKPVVAAIEASDIDGTRRPTPAEIRAEVWMALVHGALGIQYFCHRITPSVNETECLDDTATRDALSSIDARITELAPVLNTPSIAGGISVKSSVLEVPIDTMLKRSAQATYLFAVNMRDTATSASFTLEDPPAAAIADVLGEARTLDMTSGRFSDAFQPYDVHLYRIRQR